MTEEGLYDPEAPEKLRKLLRLQLGKEIDYNDFRSIFENTFNFGLDRSAVSEREFKAFETLFWKVVWYSPFPEDHAAAPNYIDEKEMDAAVAEARRALGINVK